MLEKERNHKLEISNSFLELDSNKLYDKYADSSAFQFEHAHEILQNTELTLRSTLNFLTPSVQSQVYHNCNIKKIQEEMNFSCGRRNIKNKANTKIKQNRIIEKNKLLFACLKNVFKKWKEFVILKKVGKFPL